MQNASAMRVRWIHQNYKSFLVNTWQDGSRIRNVKAFLLRYLLSIGIPRAIAIFDGIGNPISDRATLDFLAQLYPELDDFDKITIGGPFIFRPTTLLQDVEEIVEVRGSSSCFEYQFPASPEYFVGRSTVLEELDTYVAKVINKETSSRGILFEANSGWGKS